MLLAILLWWDFSAFFIPWHMENYITHMTWGENECDSSSLEVIGLWGSDHPKLLGNWYSAVLEQRIGAATQAKDVSKYVFLEKMRTYLESLVKFSSEGKEW